MPRDSVDDSEHSSGSGDPALMIYADALAELEDHPDESEDSLIRFSQLASMFVPIADFDKLSIDQAERLLTASDWFGEWAHLVYEYVCVTKGGDLSQFGYGGLGCYHPGAWGPFIPTCLIGRRGVAPDTSDFAALFRLQLAATGRKGGV